MTLASFKAVMIQTALAVTVAEVKEVQTDRAVTIIVVILYCFCSGCG
jgi:hypothetical protein